MDDALMGNRHYIMQFAYHNTITSTTFLDSMINHIVKLATMTLPNHPNEQRLDIVEKLTQLSQPENGFCRVGYVCSQVASQLVNCAAHPDLMIEPFLASWVQHLNGNGDTWTDEQYQQLLFIANLQLQLGHFELARKTIAICIKSIRKCAQDSSNVEYLGEVRKLLIVCTKVQTQLKKCAECLTRLHGAESLSLNILSELNQVLEIAPLSINATALQVCLMIRLKRFAAASDRLDTFPFTLINPQLTFEYASSLEYQGFLRKSLNVTNEFLAANRVKELVLHHDYLLEILSYKSKADQYAQQENREQAVMCYSKCLSSIRIENYSLRAQILFRLANLSIEMGQLTNAIEWLTQAHRLDPQNEMIRLRLSAILLRLEVQRMEQDLTSIQ